MRILILGASFAGLGAASELRRLLPSAHVTVVDRSDRFVYRPSLPWIVFGQRQVSDIVVPLSPLLARWGVHFVQDDVTGIEPGSYRVMGRDGTYDYDVLLIALGASTPPQPPSYLARHGHHPLWVDAVLAMREAIARFQGGGVVIAFCPHSPLACPVYEIVFHLDGWLRERGLRRRSTITVVSYEEAPFAVGGGAASRFIAGRMAERNIGFRPTTAVADASADDVTLSDGTTLPASLILYMPALQGPRVVRSVPGLADGDGMVLVDRSLQSHAYGHVFAAGDIVAFPGPKNGRMAQIQGTVAARNMAAFLGHGQEAPYSSHLACLLDLGGKRGLATLRNPAPTHGRTRTFPVWPGWLPHIAKVGLERYYMHVKLRV